MLAIGLFALAMAELATAIAAALASNISWADAVGSFTMTNGAAAHPADGGPAVQPGPL